MSTPSSAHRLEIDGLRAIAVSAVVLYHFSVTGFAGGFVGVDIFFVISGFLIGDILYRELKNTGSLSLINFYARRLRRLAPAFVVMALVTFCAAYFVLLPFEFREFGKALIASTVYLSNVYFFMRAGYFDTAAEDKPLLHTWSLSVEEQFYIFLPLLMLVFCRSHRILIIALIATFILSLGFCIAVTPLSHTATFYLFPFRAWELLAGVLLAIYGRETSDSWQHHPALSWVGLAMLAVSVAFIQAGLSFPGYQVVLPVLGTLAILYNGRHDNLVNRALSSPLPVFVGLISYSLYLWHWPVLTLSRYYRGDAGSTLETIAWMAVSVVLAYLSWRFVEQPVRRATSLKLPSLYLGAAAASACLVLIGGMIYLRDGMMNRFPSNVRAHIDASGDFLQDWSRCRTSETGALSGVEVCPIGADGPPTFLVWGDSHVRAFKEGIELRAKERNASGLLIWHAGCPPLFDIEKQESAATRQQDADCASDNARIREAVKDMPGIKSLLLIGRWSYYAEGKGIGNDDHNTIRLSRGGAKNSAISDQKALFNEAALSTLAELSNSFERIFVLRQVPEIPNYNSRIVARKIAHGHLPSHTEGSKSTAVMFSLTRATIAKRTASSERPFKARSTDGTITWLDPRDTFCSQDRCSAMQGGRSFYFDNNHITNTAALTLRKLFDPVFNANDRSSQRSEAHR